ncbi:DUF7549 family protein [Natranaeroarchaeum sulfidigenes]|uniref:Membrane protein, associated with type IV pili like system n=1 Tax=Natranaeroarchaeum sulfidigenes TaxID=2784880 RepID=A0A897MWN6_9EURY|nr:hypothetical protein [Natranaeroarchaeum sulfidigenes]QSG02725.1 Membrane protein, associated with type IV pili like system [Natranaeroarchaeum sulfidigenes]
MAWVRSEYAGELAVVSAWLAALLPWNVTYATIFEGEATVLSIRFPFVQLRYVLGIELPGSEGLSIDHPMAARSLVEGTPVIVYDLWIVGALCILAAVGLSVVMYLREEWVTERLPRSPVRVMGALLAGATIALSASTVAIITHGEFGGGLPIPIGLVVLGALSWILLTVDLA